ncbi:MAG TPA: thioesterase family protein [Thermoanaerobaculia bacterium]|nr:thioesterase family protein [Thermoanaerobaculia bacterium]
MTATTRTPAAPVAGVWRDGWYVVPYDVIFRDLDYFGHVNNAVFLTYFEVARTRLWFTLNGGTKPGDISFIVARAEVDFLRQIGMEPIEILVRIGEMRTTSIDFVYEIRRAGDSHAAATGKIVVVLFDWATQSKVRVSDELRQRVAAFQQ